MGIDIKFPRDWVSAIWEKERESGPESEILNAFIPKTENSDNISLPILLDISAMY